MARIKINDLPKNKKISKTELKGIFGGEDIFPALKEKINQVLSLDPDWMPGTQMPHMDWKN